MWFLHLMLSLGDQGWLVRGSGWKLGNSVLECVFGRWNRMWSFWMLWDLCCLSDLVLGASWCGSVASSCEGPFYQTSEEISILCSTSTVLRKVLRLLFPVRFRPAYSWRGKGTRCLSRCPWGRSAIYFESILFVKCASGAVWLCWSARAAAY